MERIDFTSLMGPVAIRLWGTPSKTTQWKLYWGRKFARVVNLTSGVWYDHENKRGSGVLDLIERERNCSKAEAVAWLRENSFVREEEITTTATTNAKPIDNRPGRLVAEYEYQDEAGELLFTVCKFDRDGQKQFRPYRPDAKKPGILGKTKWEEEAGLEPVRLVPFRLPELLAAIKRNETVFITEGEKDALALVELGLTATTNPFGASKWEPSFNEYFRGADLVVLPDHDEAGLEHHDVLYWHLAPPVAKSFRSLFLWDHWPEGEAAEKADVSDWLAAGGTMEQLRYLVSEVKPAEPETKTEMGEPLPDAEESNVILFDLAKLKKKDWLGYERERTKAAKKLGARPGALDKKVQELAALVEENPDMEFMKPPEPWETPVGGEDLLNELVEVVERHVIMAEAASTATALWIMHSHAHDAAEHSPNLVFSSPTPRCGKTTVLKLVGRLVSKALCSVNISSAVLFRATETYRPTLVLDEADTMNKDNHELRGILNSGHERDQAYVLRCDGDEHKIRRFSTWSPKAVALIGRLHPTLEDRSIRVEMKRRLQTEKIERIPRSKDSFDTLKRKCARWAQDHVEALRKADPDLPEEINDRARDNWRPLLAIADAVGGEWPEVARKAATKLTVVDDDNEVHAVQLLRDIKFIFEQEGDERLLSSFIADELGKLEDSPWPEYGYGKNPIKPSGVAKLLKPFKIYPRKVSIGGRQQQGYALAWFKYAFKRYLPPEPEATDAKAKEKE